MGFPSNSAGKDSTCNAGDTSSIPGLGKSIREGIGYSLQYSWASLMAQLVKNLPAMRETCFQSPDWEDPLEKGKDYPLKYSGLENSMGLQKVRHDCVTFTGELWKRRTNHVWKQLFIYKWGFPGCTSGNRRDCITRLPMQET